MLKIAVCNGKGGIGKTTVSLSLALAFSQSGHKVGFIDRDIRAPFPKSLKAFPRWATQSSAATMMSF
jgi:Mrp family chromosome partitioning ATPase